jgi:hypothetical protein
VGSAHCHATVSVDSCTFFRGGVAQLGRKCLQIPIAYYLSFIAGSCWENVHQSQLSVATDCFDISSGGAHYGQYVDYYASSGGVVLSAALVGNDFASLGCSTRPRTRGCV